MRKTRCRQIQIGRSRSRVGDQLLKDLECIKAILTQSTKVKNVACRSGGKHFSFVVSERPKSSGFLVLAFVCYMALH